MAAKKTVAKKPKQKSKLGIDELKAFFENAEELARLQADPKKASQLLKYAEAALGLLDRGEARIWEPSTDTVNIWCKHAILSYFRVKGAKPMNAGCFEFFDKVALKSRSSLKDVRVVPGAVARFGSYISPGVILMPSFVNIGAYVGAGTMVDTWATVGSCAQVGAGVHLSGGVGIGGVLEPAQAKPVVIEDGAFIGSRVHCRRGRPCRPRSSAGRGSCFDGEHEDCRRPWWQSRGDHWSGSRALGRHSRKSSQEVSGRRVWRSVCTHYRNAKRFDRFENIIERGFARPPGRDLNLRRET